jgi:hypothetical protein
MKPAQLLSLAAVGLFCAGCVPWRFTSSPGASGVVMDAKTYAAIGGAQVTVCRSEFPMEKPRSVTNALKNARPPRIVTKADGRFSIDRESKWVMFYPAPMPMPPVGEIVIQRDGYEPLMLPLTSDPNQAGGSDKFLVGDVLKLAPFAARLKAGSDPVSTWLMERFSQEGRAAVADYPQSGINQRVLQSILVKELDTIILGPSIFETNRFRGVTLSPLTLDLMEHNRSLGALHLDAAAYRQTFPDATSPAFVTAMLNRKLLEDAYPGELSSKRGEGYYKNVGVVLMTPIVK